jgi:hypothetical protein
LYSPESPPLSRHRNSRRLEGESMCAGGPGQSGSHGAEQRTK